MPLKVDKLQKELQKAVEETFPPALERAMLTLVPGKSESGSKCAKEFAKVATKLLAEVFSTRIAYAIDYYVKNADVYGTIITTGGPTTQMARIESASPLTNGKVPNSFGIK